MSPASARGRQNISVRICTVPTWHRKRFMSNCQVEQERLCSTKRCANNACCYLQSSSTLLNVGILLPFAVCAAGCKAFGEQPSHWFQQLCATLLSSRRAEAYADLQSNGGHLCDVSKPAGQSYSPVGRSSGLRRRVACLENEASPDRGVPVPRSEFSLASMTVRRRLAGPAGVQVGAAESKLSAPRVTQIVVDICVDTREGQRTAAAKGSVRSSAGSRGGGVAVVRPNRIYGWRS